MASTQTGTITTENSGKGIGTTTMGATAGTALAGALAGILVWLLSLSGVEVPLEVQTHLIIIIGAIGTLVGGYLTPTNKAKVETHIVNAPVDYMSPPVVPDGTGDHRLADSIE